MIPTYEWVIDTGDSILTSEDIAIVEKKRAAVYIGDFCLKTKNGSWSEQPAAIFYNETPPNPSFSKYFGLFFKHDPLTHRFKSRGTLFITDGSSAFQEPINAVVADNGDVIYSRWRHDYRFSKDKSVWVDGGRDYMRSGVYSPERYVKIICVQDKLVTIPSVEAVLDSLKGTIEYQINTDRSIHMAFWLEEYIKSKNKVVVTPDATP